MSADKIDHAVERGLMTPDEGKMMHALEADASPEGIARAVLDYHAIRPEWVRNGEQIAVLIAEGVRIARAHFAAWEAAE